MTYCVWLCSLQDAFDYFLLLYFAQCAPNHCFVYTRGVFLRFLRRNGGFVDNAHFLYMADFRVICAAEYMENTPQVLRAVEQLVFLQSKQVLVSCGADGHIRFWDFKEGRVIHSHHADMS